MLLLRMVHVYCGKKIKTTAIDTKLMIQDRDINKKKDALGR
jgi:hypothetical protein